VTGSANPHVTPNVTPRETGASTGPEELSRGVLVVGAGLLGTSVALALTATGVDVRLRDCDADALETALTMGAGRAEQDADTPAALAVVAVPPAQAGTAVTEILRSGAAEYATDVASVKVLPAEQVRAGSTTPGRYVGSHPMAGREVSGARAALPDLFEGRPWVMCPDASTDQQAVVRTLAVARTCGAAPVTMAAASHDAAVALVSHAPHVVSALVAGLLVDAPAQQVRLAGPGVTDVTRVAAADPSMWSEILQVNATAVRTVLTGLRDSLDDVLDSLSQVSGTQVSGQQPVRQNEQAARLDAALQRGVDGRFRLPGKHGLRGVDYDTVTIVVDDRPGQLAAVFADTDRIGVNVEDVRIEHRPGQPVGALQLDVLAGHGATLQDGLQQQGWTVHG